jgi:trehalose/maltose transport system substrate-binding protein
MESIANTVTTRPRVARTRWISAGATRTFVFLLLAMALVACRQFESKPVTLRYFRLGWTHSDEWSAEGPLSQRFTRETGIHLKDLPVPESALDQLDLSRKLLESSYGPDVLSIDLISSGVLAQDLLDLRPYLAVEISSIEPELLPSYTVDGALVAIPNSVQVGVLQYRSDLLRKYGYEHPPKTWDDLERMAQRIQAGERAQGKEDFWGYVWQGASAEALTCNALEWQVAEGGGRIIEEDRTISVNNPAAIRAWRRAKRWIGSISPPGVLEYRELDSINVFNSGRAAFNRVWRGTTITRSGQSRQIRWVDSLAEGKIGYTSIPGGAQGWAGTLGGSGLAVSRNSVHPKEATEFVRFLIREQIQLSKEWLNAFSITQPEDYVQPSVGDAHNASAGLTQPRSTLIGRPSSVTGRKYEEVTRAYINAVHSVLAGEKAANATAAELEKQLVSITGFQIGPPRLAH